MNTTLGDAVQSFFSATMELSGENTNTKDVRERKKQAKQHIIDIMKHDNIPFIEIEGQFLVLKHKTTKPPINNEFAARAYNEFHKDPQRGVGEPNQVAACFGEFMFALQKHLSETTDDLKLSKKKPMAALLFDEFTG